MSPTGTLASRCAMLRQEAMEPVYSILNQLLPFLVLLSYTERLEWENIPVSTMAHQPIMLFKKDLKHH